MSQTTSKKPESSNIIKIEVKNKDLTKGKTSGAATITYNYNNEYVSGDIINITAPESVKHLIVQTDPNIVESLIYLPESIMTYTAPTGEKLNAFSPDAFRGSSHIIKARIAGESEIYAYRNLALNSMDQRGSVNYFPHAKANFVNGDMVCLEERNAIDGLTENDRHGNYPWQSWGGGARDDLQFKVSFGRKIETDKITFYLRADFANDHDTYWESLNIEFSDGATVPIRLEKTGKPQTFTFPPKNTFWVSLLDLKQPSLPLSFAALTEIEVYGKEIRSHMDREE